jgi:S-adenosylmethionine synthetase
MSNRIFTSESVTEGHPIKYATKFPTRYWTDHCTRQQRRALPARRIVSTGMALIMGEITTETYADIPILPGRRSGRSAMSIRNGL